MAIGKRKRERQETLWIRTGSDSRTAGPPLLSATRFQSAQHGFDGFVEQICAKFYAPNMGRPGLIPGMYFRLLLIGYFEGLDSERGIAWRTADSLALRNFLGLTLMQAPPDHSTISRTRRLIDLETHQAVFTWVLQRIADAGLLKGKTIGIDATTLEANAALRSIVRRNTGDSYQAFLLNLSTNDAGMVTKKPSLRFMAIAAEYAGRGVRHCSGCEENDWNVPSPICTKPAECAALICAVGKIYSNAY